jgi:hypothetical protein
MIDGDGLALLRPLWNDLALARATELARLGRYGDAESLLSGLSKEPPIKYAVLDLQARIRAQLGDLVEARCLWNELLREQPRHAEARAAVARLDRMAKPKERATVDLIYQPWATHEPGLVVGADKGDVAIQFETDPFVESGYELTDDAKQLSTRLGRQLELLVGQILLEVTGSGKLMLGNRPQGCANVEGLGLARSYAVTQHLLKTTKLQEWMFLIRAKMMSRP